MEDQQQTLDDYLDILRRRKWQLIVPAVLLSVTAVLVALLLPATYRSSATILIEQQEIPTNLVQTTVTSYADQRIQVISRRVMTTENLSKLIERFNLYPEIPRNVSMGAAVEKLRDAIKLDMISADVMDPRSGRPQEATIAFSLSFEHESPQMAQQVTSSLVSLFLTENLEQRQSAVTETTSFLRAEADKLGGEIATLEARLATFKEEHSETLPEFASLNREMMSRTESQLRDNAQSTQNLEQQKLYLESELSLRESTPTGGSSDNPLRRRLTDLEAQYAQAVSRYSPTHPDRIRLEREISALRNLVGPPSAADLEAKLAQLKAELASLRERYSENHPNVAALKRAVASTKAQLAQADQRGPNNAPSTVGEDPAYVQLRTRLEAVQAEINSLKDERTKLDAELTKYEDYVKAAPKIEQQYRAITRDYDNAMHKYQEVRDKVLQAELAQSLETKRKGERFALIEPPLVPEQPVKPNRPAILLLGFILSMAAGVGHVALREALDKSIHGTRGLRHITRVPILGAVPFIETKRDRRRRAQRLTLATIGSLLVILGGLWIVNTFLKPLDVLAFEIVNKVESYLPPQQAQPDN